MSNIYPLVPIFSSKTPIGGDFVKTITEIDDKQNARFNIELIGNEKVVNNYIENMIVMDLRVSWIEESTFNKLIKSKEAIHKENFNNSQEQYKCLGIENCTKDINKYYNKSKLDGEFNIIDERVLNINIDLIEPYHSWNYFYFQIDPAIDGFNDDVARGLIHRYKQRFAQGRGFIDLTVNGGECGLSINSNAFQYYTRTRDCPPCEWDANTSRYQITDVCGGKKRSGNYSISGGWAFFSVIE